jgi:photosystem II stability/assembly factor-like uncharacterized protein
MRLKTLLFTIACLVPLTLAADEPDPLDAAVDGLKFRSIGPAIYSGRIADIAVHPDQPSTWFVAAASGGLWKTTNAGTTWDPVFDQQPSFSLGCVALDPRNPFVVWVGTGENNSQRSVSWGDGVYRSTDGGTTWQNMGLPHSEHIGKILVDPRDSRIVYVAAQGPLWSGGGDRGLFKSSDAGSTWKAILTISEQTGVTDIVFDPRDPDVLYAASYQRRRHVWTMIDGGPESALYKSTDGGATWTHLTAGLPTVDLGRIGLAIPGAAPDIVYATVEAADGKGGFFRSTDRGATWQRQSTYISGSPQYYQEIFCDPADPDRVYAMDVYLHVTEDGGKTFRKLGERSKHVDNHAMWIDPNDPRHCLVGTDGGLYETFDRGATWKHFGNLPLTQFYRVSVDNSDPFYYVYGGTQDNMSVGGPSRTINEAGIVSSDWFVTVTGDGYESQADPENPAIVYAESQYGGLVRFDRRSGEISGIKPREDAGSDALRWNWDSPLLLSPHSRSRLYFASNKLFRSDDRGVSWTAISGDLTRQLDRNAFPVMGRVWGPDAVSKSASTSLFGNSTALSESPLEPGLLYVGTDDGLLQVTEDGGSSWRRIDRFPGVPELTYVSRVEASQHQVKRVYAAFDNHKNGDFRPYLLRSEDAGRTWKTIAGNLPAGGPVYALAEDHQDPNLLFAGTEYGVFFTNEGGTRWTRLRGGLPRIAVRDLAIQKRANDLVLGTFGRGFYILDDYTPLRWINAEVLDQEAHLFPVREAPLYHQARPYGYRGKSFLGEDFFAAENPPFGATVTYYLKNPLTTRKERRQSAEQKAQREGRPIRYPSLQELSLEDREEPPTILLTVRDESGEVVRRILGTNMRGINRVTWDLRYAPTKPVELTPPEENPFSEGNLGFPALPGRYAVTVTAVEEGTERMLAGPVPFTATALGLATLGAEDQAALADFQQKVAELQRAAFGAARALEEITKRVEAMRQAFLDAPAAPSTVRMALDSLDRSATRLLVALKEDRTRKKRSEPLAPTVLDRLEAIVDEQWLSSSAPTRTQERAYEIASGEFAAILEELRALDRFERQEVFPALERAGAPWTPGRIPQWRRP